MTAPTIKSVLTAVRFSAGGITLLESLFSDPDDLANHFAEYVNNEEHLFDSLPAKIYDQLTNRNKFRNLARYFLAALVNQTDWLTINAAAFTNFKSGLQAQQAALTITAPTVITPAIVPANTSASQPPTMNICTPSTLPTPPIAPTSAIRNPYMRPTSQMTPRIGPLQLIHLPHSATGMPDNLIQTRHPLLHCLVCDDANPQRSARGPTVDTVKLKPASCFHMDFGFMRASSEDYKQKKGEICVVTLFDGFNAYLLVTNAKSRYVWVFLTVSKSPPCDYIDSFLARNKHEDGIRSIHVNQGGELWRADELQQIVHHHHYVMEPTGSDSGPQNGKVKRLNGKIQSLKFCAHFQN